MNGMSERDKPAMSAATVTESADRRSEDEWHV